MVQRSEQKQLGKCPTGDSQVKHHLKGHWRFTSWEYHFWGVLSSYFFFFFFNGERLLFHNQENCVAIVKSTCRNTEGLPGDNPQNPDQVHWSTQTRREKDAPHHEQCSVGIIPNQLLQPQKSKCCQTDHGYFLRNYYLIPPLPFFFSLGMKQHFWLPWLVELLKPLLLWISERQSTNG